MEPGGDGVLKVGGGTAPLEFGAVELSGVDLVISGAGGTEGADYYVIASTNAASPVAEWESIATNKFGPDGSFSFTNMVDPNLPQRFYLLQQP